MSRPVQHKYLSAQWRYLLSVGSTLVVIVLLAAFQPQVNSTTVALSLLLVVLFIATFFGSRPALLGSVISVLGINFYFLPPLGTLTIADPQNWIALAAFLITAVTAGQLSARARRRAEEAESGKIEIERLYGELKEAFERASQAEAAKQSERLKSALLDAVSHDIRTPLTSIKASVTTLLDEARNGSSGSEEITIDPESRMEMLEVIDEESDRLDRFVEGLIELARLEAGEMQLRRRWTSMEEIISTALERAEPLTSGHLVVYGLEKDLPAARVDSRTISEAVYTLIDNAAKYSPVGSRITITARYIPEGLIETSVSDQGRGIPLNLRARVFDKFFRAVNPDNSEPKSITGTGLGLSIARGIVEAHGGSIRIEDNPEGSGSRFIFTIPIGEPEDSIDAASGVGTQALDEDRS